MFVHLLFLIIHTLCIPNAVSPSVLSQLLLHTFFSPRAFLAFTLSTFTHFSPAPEMYAICHHVHHIHMIMRSSLLLLFIKKIDIHIITCLGDTSAFNYYVYSQCEFHMFLDYLFLIVTIFKSMSGVFEYCCFSSVKNAGNGSLDK